MPILYPLAFLFYFLSYWIDKWLVFSYHQKTMTFNEELPVMSSSLFKLPIFLHLIFSIIAYSEGQVFYDYQIEPEDLGIADLTTQDLLDEIPEEVPINLDPLLEREYKTPLDPYKTLEDPVKRFF